MIYDAIVLAGGRSSRLGGSPKSALLREGRTLLALAVDAASGARRIVVVADDLPDDLDLGVADRVELTREEPRFGGPVAAISAAVDLLEEDGTADDLLVLACDMPDAAPGVAAVLDAALARRGHGVAGFVAVDDDGHPQPLLALYDGARLVDALAQLGDPHGASMRALTASLDLIGVAVPEGSSDDVDTWVDAARLDIEEPA